MCCWLHVAAAVAAGDDDDDDDDDVIMRSDSEDDSYRRDAAVSTNFNSKYLFYWLLKLLFFYILTPFFSLWINWLSCKQPLGLLFRRHFTDKYSFNCLARWLDLSYALSLTVEQRPQTSLSLHPALSCAAASIFLQLYLNPAVHISFPRSLLQLFLALPPSL